ncbi:MAG: lipoyl(octanoyl) transferase LipB [Nitrospirales bacterium]|nr:lipoyl(octanoyl) transferase LipB [Nitrospirales bacterium]
MSVSRHPAVLHILPSVVSYQKAWKRQQQLLEDRIACRRHDTLVILEHAPVFTLGRRSHPEHMQGDLDGIYEQGYAVQEVERGGAVTYHGPGQVVGYPVLQLRHYCTGPKVYVGMLEEVVLRVLREWNIVGRQIEQWRGVWVGESESTLRKIAAIGIHITRGVTMHGFALNVNVDLSPFDLIVPCGIKGCHVTSLAKELGSDVDITVVKERLAHHFADVFGLDWEASHSLSMIP